MTTDVFGHPWLGGLFADAEAAAIWSADRQLAQMLRVEAAFARALGRAGAAPAAAAERAAAAIEAHGVDVAALREGTARDGLPAPDLVRRLKRAAGADADAVHAGMTSQDVLDTALALTIRDFNAVLGARLGRLSAALAALCARDGAITIMGRTRMQAALPIRFADRAAGWARPLAAHAERLAALRPRVEILQLGGAVGDRAALGAQGPAIAADMAARLGLGDPPAAWHAARDGLAEYAGLLSLIAGTLGKMGQDVCLMAQQGVDEAQVSGGGGSSAMPHKQNPILAELLVTLARYNATQIAGLHHALIHEQERSGAAWMLEWMILPAMAQTTARSLSAALDLCGRLTIAGRPDDR